MKKIMVFSLCLVLIFSLTACNSKTIGTISGPENDYITIDNVKYEFDNENNYTSSDRDKYLGKVTNSKITMKVYSVKGDTENEYIYTLWDWEGAFYRKQE